MKKLFALFLAMMMVFSLAACGGGGEKTPAGEDSTPSVGDLIGSQIGKNALDPDDLRSVMESANRSNMTPEQIAELEADAAANGYEIDWNDDGSLRIIEGDSVINTDGAWPKNEFTADVPVPDKDMIVASEVSEDGCTIMMTWTAEDAKAYAGELKKAGFDRDAEEQDLTSMGLYTYSASNGAYTATAMFAAGTGGIEIERAGSGERREQEDMSASGGDADMQKQPEEVQKESEGTELPEGYEDLLGSLGLSGLTSAGGLDLSGLTGGLAGALSGGGYGNETKNEWPDGLRAYEGGVDTDFAEGGIAVYGTTMEEMQSYVSLLKQDGFAYMDFYDSGMTEEQMLESLEQWHGSNGTLYLKIGYGFGDLGLGYGESGTVTIEYTYEKPGWDDVLLG